MSVGLPPVLCVHPILDVWKGEEKKIQQSSSKHFFKAYLFFYNFKWENSINLNQMTFLILGREILFIQNKLTTKILCKYTSSRCGEVEVTDNKVEQTVCQWKHNTHKYYLKILLLTSYRNYRQAT